jgi:hypothetical protein
VVRVIAGVNQLLVSDDAARKVNVRGLDGQIFSKGVPIYAFVGPRNKLANIKKVTFWIDDPARTGKAFSIENISDFDLARTADNGKAYPLESNLLLIGSHIVTASVEYLTGPSVVLSANITIKDTQTHRLQVSSRSDRTQATDLAGASLSGNVYIFMGTKGDSIVGVREVVFFLDGKQVRRDASVDYDLVGNWFDGKALPFDTRKLNNGKHELVALVRLSGDDVELAYRAGFTVSNGHA